MSFFRFNLYAFAAFFLFAAIILPLTETAETSDGKKSAYELILQKLEKADPQGMDLQQEQTLIIDLKSLAQTDSLRLPLTETAGISDRKESAYELILRQLEKADLKSMDLQQTQAFIIDLKSLAQTEVLLPSSFYGATYGATGAKRRELSAWEARVGQQVVAIGQTLEGSGDVSSTLLQGGQALLPDSTEETQKWVKDKLRGVLPQTDDKMASSALNAATNELARGTSGMANNYALSQVGLSDETDVSGHLNQMALRSGVEGMKAAAAASSVYALNHMEMDYTLSDSGVDDYSVLMVQPLWNNMNMRHNIFMQVSYSNKDVTDTASDTSLRRDTVNTGLAYRYITPNEQHMFGVNSFFDHQWPYHHNRMSMGLDYKNSLYGVAFNKYFGLSDWRGRADGYEEKALGGEDLEFSGRLRQVPELELFVKGYHWAQEKTAVENPEGTDIWGYQVAAEYTPMNAFSIRSAISKDNEMSRAEGEFTVRLNYTFGQSWNDLWSRPRPHLDTVVSRRFEKVRRTNEIRVQTRQNPNVTARVTFAQGANVSVGQSLAFGVTMTTSNAVGNAATAVFGNGARLDIGQSTSVRLEKDRVVLISGLMQYTSGTGGITIIGVPNGTINLLGTDVDVRVAGGTTTLRVRDGAADFKDESGTTRVDREELAESQGGDSTPPQRRVASTTIYETHAGEAHNQLDLVGPVPTTPKAAPYAKEDVSVSGTMSVGQTLTFTVPLSSAVTVTGVPQLAFTLGGQDRLADYDSGSGTTALTFTYTVTSSDETLSTIVAQEIQKNGGSLMGSNGAPMILTVSGTLSGTVPDLAVPTITALTAVASGASPAETGDVITFTLDATEALVQTGAPTLTLDVGGVERTAAFASIVSGNATFTYTVQADDSDLDGITVTAINAAAGELTDASGNDLDLTLAALPQNMVLEIQGPIFTFDVVNTQTIAGQISTKAGESVTIEWGDGTSNTYTGTDQAYSKNYGSVGNRTVVFKGGSATLTKFTMTQAGANISFDLAQLPRSVTYFLCGGSNTVTGNLSSLPAGLTYFNCGGSNTVTGNLSSLPSGLTNFQCYGSNTVTGNLSSLPSGLTYFNCQGSNTVTGNLSSLPAGLTDFQCYGSNTVTGNLSSLPAGLTTFGCTGSNTVTGNLSSLPAGLTYFHCGGSNTVTGNLSSLPAGLTSFTCTGSNTIGDYSGKTWANNQRRVYLTPVAGGGLSSAEIDQLLIDLAAAGGTWNTDKEVYLRGTNAARTAASDAAVATLISKGVAVTTTP